MAYNLPLRKTIPLPTKLLNKDFDVLNIHQIYTLLNYFHNHYIKFISGDYYYNTRIYKNFRSLIKPEFATVTTQKHMLY